MGIQFRMGASFRFFLPGWVLLAKEIEWAIAQGIREVDMMRGDEDYKYKFGAIDRYIMHTRCALQ